MRKILFFGNSLTAGYGLASPDTQSFPALILQKIRAAKLPYQVVNAGVSGDTSSAGLNRLSYWLSSPIDVFILELGVNDFIRGLPTSAIELNLDNILKRVTLKYPHCKLAVMGMEIPNILPAQKIGDFRNIFRKLAERHHAAFVPFFLEGVANVPQLNLRDGIHPSAKGYEVISENVWPVIKTLLEETREAEEAS
jgi:acyl-CoA thioesterase-1